MRAVKTGSLAVKTGSLFETFAISLFKIRSSCPLVEPRIGANRLILEKPRLQSQAGKALLHNARAPEDRSGAATIRESESDRRRSRMQDCMKRKSRKI